tara:strand:- start:4226 stop:7666 length:3441 start_codon:yes stop_codon:yes gene_type:complete
MRRNYSNGGVVNSTSAKVARSISKFSGKLFQDAANIKHEKDFVDGQMASAQGQAFEDIESEGNKWKLSGYRAVEAQTLSSTMLASQKALLKQTDYKSNPDEYRATVMNRLEKQLEGLDPRIARMVTEQFSMQIPALTAAHTQAHLSYEQQQASIVVRRSMDVMSMDDGQLDSFISVASGEAGSDGMSVEARTSAVTNGVVDAFANGNPQAYAKLKTAGVLDQFSPAQVKAMDKAAKALDKSERTKFNADFEDGLDALEQDMLTGGYVDDPERYVTDLSNLHTDHGMIIRASDARSAYGEAKDEAAAYAEGLSLRIREAALRGDHATIAEITEPMMLRVENLGEGEDPAQAGDTTPFHVVPSAVLSFGEPLETGREMLSPETLSERFERVEAQLSDPTVVKTDADIARMEAELDTINAAAEFEQIESDLADPNVTKTDADIARMEARLTELNAAGTTPLEGFGDSRVPNLALPTAEAGPSPKEVAKKTKSAWKAYMGGSESDIRYNWAPADAEAAMIALKEGPDVANAFIDGGRDYGVLKKETLGGLQQFLSVVSGEKHGTIQSAGADRNKILADKLSATQKRIDMELHVALNDESAALTEAYQNDEISLQEHEAGQLDILARRKDGINEAKIMSIKDQTAKFRAKAQKAVDEHNREVTDSDAASVERQLERYLEDPSVSSADKIAATKQAQDAIRQIYSDAGVGIADFGDAALTERLDTVLTDGLVKSQEYAMDTVAIETAFSDGTASDLSKAQLQRGFDEANANIDAEVDKRVTAGDLTAEQGDAIKTGEKLKMMSTAGAIDPKMRANLTSQMAGKLAIEGLANPVVLRATQAYQQLKAMNPTLAGKLMSEKAVTQAEAIISATGAFGHFDLTSGMVALHEQEFSGAVYGADNAIDPEKWVEESDAAVSAMQESGNITWFNTIFDAKTVAGQSVNRLDIENEQMAGAEKLREQVTDLILDEAHRIATVRPGHAPEFYMDRAQQLVGERVSHMGNTIITMDSPDSATGRQFGVKSQLFGAKAYKFDADGIEDKVILEWLRDVKSKEEGFEDIGDVSTGEAIAEAVRFIPLLNNLPFGDLSGGDVSDIQERGVRPVTYNTDGKNLFVTILGSDGQPTHRNIPVPLKEIGAKYMNDHEVRVTYTIYSQ